MKAVVAAFNQEKALVGAFSVLCLRTFAKNSQSWMEKAWGLLLVGSAYYHFHILYTINSLLPRIDFSYLGCHKTYFWVGRG